MNNTSSLCNSVHLSFGSSSFSKLPMQFLFYDLFNNSTGLWYFKLHFPCCPCASMQRASGIIFDVTWHSILKLTDEGTEAQETRGHAVWAAGYSSGSSLPCRRACHQIGCHCRLTLWLSLESWNLCHFGSSSEGFITDMNNQGTLNTSFRVWFGALSLRLSRFNVHLFYTESCGRHTRTDSLHEGLASHPAQKFWDHLPIPIMGSHVLLVQSLSTQRLKVPDWPSYGPLGYLAEKPGKRNKQAF